MFLHRIQSREHRVKVSLGVKVGIAGTDTGKGIQSAATEPSWEVAKGQILHQASCRNQPCQPLAFQLLTNEILTE